jgi:hypothetical protein
VLLQHHTETHPQSITSSLCPSPARTRPSPILTRTHAHSPRTLPRARTQNPSAKLGSFFQLLGGGAASSAELDAVIQRQRVPTKIQERMAKVAASGMVTITVTAVIAVTVIRSLLLLSLLLLYGHCYFCHCHCWCWCCCQCWCCSNESIIIRSHAAHDSGRVSGDIFYCIPKQTCGEIVFLTNHIVKPLFILSLHPTPAHPLCGAAAAASSLSQIRPMRARPASRRDCRRSPRCLHSTCDKYFARSVDEG